MFRLPRWIDTTFAVFATLEGPLKKENQVLILAGSQFLVNSQAKAVSLVKMRLSARI